MSAYWHQGAVDLANEAGFDAEINKGDPALLILTPREENDDE